MNTTETIIHRMTDLLRLIENTLSYLAENAHDSTRLIPEIEWRIQRSNAIYQQLQRWIEPWPTVVEQLPAHAIRRYKGNPGFRARLIREMGEMRQHIDRAAEALILETGYVRPS